MAHQSQQSNKKEKWKHKSFLATGRVGARLPVRLPRSWAGPTMVMGVPLHHRAMVEGGGDDVELGVRVVTGAAAIEGAHGRGGTNGGNHSNRRWRGGKRGALQWGSTHRALG
jgi:hypothetical protein